jgi:penicillin-binding protein 1C
VLQTVHYEPAVEPSRREGFLPGTQMSLVALPSIEAAHPHIVGPGNGAILALDPDIPADRQIIHFSAVPPRPGLGWKVDGETTSASLDGNLNWQPVPGAHTILLMDAKNEPQDETRLVVKGRLAPVASQR